MKIIKTTFVLSAVLFFTISSSFSQYEELPKEEKIYKNSGGIDYLFGGINSLNIGLTYRRFFEESKYNLKASFYFGGNNQYYGNNNMLIYTTADSIEIGVFNFNGYSSNQQRLKLGLEKKIKLWKINLVAGADVFFGHRVSFSSSRVTNAYNTSVVQNGFTYKQYTSFSDTSTFGLDLNFLQTKRNYINFGAGFRVGTFLNISPRFYASAFIGVQFATDVLVKEKFDYQNDFYKEHIPITQYKPSTSFNYDYTSSLGLHYRF